MQKNIDVNMPKNFTREFEEMGYCGFLQLKQMSEDGLLIAYIYEYRVFNLNSFNERLSSFDKNVVYSWGAGNSNFDEIRFCAPVQEADGSLSLKEDCVADSDMMKRFREKAVRKPSLLQEIELRKKNSEITSI